MLHSTKTHSSTPSTGTFPMAQADRCVQCGLCLPHCPTYRHTRSENESPRGRIALMKALASGKLSANPRLTSHLDLCLSCRNCESVCPAQVPYEHLLDSARAEVQKQHPGSLTVRLAWRILGDGLIAKPRRLEAIGRWLYRYQGSLIDRWIQASGLLRLLGLQRHYEEMPELAPPHNWRQFYYPAERDHRGEVDFFIGCAARVTDTNTLLSAIKVLNHFGYGVHVPYEQTCCGALHLHGGRPALAQDLMRQNLLTHSSQAVPVISTASGCAATLKEYGTHIDEQEAAEFGKRVIDFSAFINTIEWRGSPTLEKTVALHEPCTLRNVMKSAPATRQMLDRIKGLKVIELADNRSCCGAAGIYFLTQPEMSQRLLADKIAAVRASGATTVVTSNVGCAMHLVSGLHRAGLKVEVKHPAQILLQALALDSARG